MLTCCSCEKPIRGNAGREEYDEVTQTNRYTCRACVRLQDRVLRQAQAPMTTHGQRYATCRCCGKEARDVEARPRGAAKAAQRFLCLACWEDPAPGYADCRHGRDWVRPS